MSSLYLLHAICPLDLDFLVTEQISHAETDDRVSITWKWKNKFDSKVFSSIDTIWLATRYIQLKVPRLRLETYLGTRSGLVQRRRIRSSTAFQIYLYHSSLSESADTVSRVYVFGTMHASVNVRYAVNSKYAHAYAYNSKYIHIHVKILRKKRLHKKCSTRKSSTGPLKVN